MDFTTVEDLAGPVDLRVVTVDTASFDPAAVEEALTDGLVHLGRRLVEARDRRVAVDVRVPDAGAGEAHHEAAVELVRGLVQGYVAESGDTIGPVNVVVTDATQDADRSTTWRFLGDTTGGLARGATFDLRSPR